MTNWIRWFDEVGMDDLPAVGGKNASLGEMRRALTPLGIRTPDGFATTADAYRAFLRAADLERVIEDGLRHLDVDQVDRLQAAGGRVRSAILAADLPEALVQGISDAYHRLEGEYGSNCDVAVRSSATAEDLPDASFAGQQETYLNIHGEAMLIDAVKRCYASLFTDRAIVYRVHRGFDHSQVALSVGVQTMVRSDLACAGVMFSIDTETGFSNAVLVNGAYGLGESVVQGTVNPDEFYVFKPTLAKGFRPILQKKLGTKEFKLVYEEGGTRQTRSVPVSREDRERFVLSDDDILTLARWAVLVEEHYSRLRGTLSPMDIEWAKDGRSGELFLVQARPETVHTQRDPLVLERFQLEARGEDRFSRCPSAGVGLMPEKPQQHTLSVRIDDTLRRRLERARQLLASKTGEAVSTSEIAKRFLESARDDRLEVVDLLADPTGSLLRIRQKGEAGLVLSRAEWTTLAHFVQQGVEAVSAQTPHPVSRESLVALLDAFVAVHDLRSASDGRLEAYYLGNLPPASRPLSKSASRSKPSALGAIHRTLAEVRRHLQDPSATWVPLMLGRNLFVLLDEDQLPGAEDLTRVLRPYWPVLWRLAARGHYILTQQPVREPSTARDGVYRPPIPSLTEGAYTLSFAQGQGQEFSLLVGFPGARGPRYPIVGFPRIAEFRTMLADLLADRKPGDWTGAYFYAAVTSPSTTEISEVWFRAHDNGVSFGLTVAEWRTVHRLFQRAWELPEIRGAWDALTREYGEV